AALLKKAAADDDSRKKRCEALDTELMADLRKAGGEKYARLAALAYRQCFAAGKFVADANGQPLQFCKENHSNGCIGTSDVFYPMAPQFLLFGPTLAKSFLVPFMNYAESEVHLSVKAIIGRGACAKLCDLRGRDEKSEELNWTASKYRMVAAEFAQRWVKEADDGDHFRLAFDRPGTWSQKYNLIWDRIL